MKRSNREIKPAIAHKTGQERNWKFAIQQPRKLVSPQFCNSQNLQPVSQGATTKHTRRRRNKHKKRAYRAQRTSLRDTEKSSEAEKNSPRDIENHSATQKLYSEKRKKYLSEGKTNLLNTIAAVELKRKMLQLMTQENGEFKPKRTVPERTQDPQASGADI